MTNAKLIAGAYMAVPTNITGTSFNINYTTSFTGSFDLYYFAIGV
jgi:hypothetical protein